jgi:hypothetical protein
VGTAVHDDDVAVACVLAEDIKADIGRGTRRAAQAGAKSSLSA